MKGIEMLKVFRPELADAAGRNVQARITVGISDDSGVPRHTSRFFVMGPRCDRKTAGGQRSSPLAGFERWNNPTPAVPATATTPAKPEIPGGRVAFKFVIQHVAIEDAYAVQCVAQKAPAEAKQPPGNAPYCQTTDGVTARRWDGKTFAQIPCLGAACPLRQEPPLERGKRQPKPAKTKLTIVGRLHESAYPAVLFSLATGSDVNLMEWSKLIEGAEKQWDAMCIMSGIHLPISWYGVPIRVAIYTATASESRFPRLHFSLAVSLEDLFRASIEHRTTVKQLASALPMDALQLTAGDIDHADNVEVLAPAQPERSPSALDRAAGLVVDVEPEPVTGEHQIDMVAQFRSELADCPDKDAVYTCRDGWQMDHEQGPLWPDMLAAVQERLTAVGGGG